MKVKQIWESRLSLGKLLNDDNLDAALAWRLKDLAAGLRDLELAHGRLLQQFGEPQEDGRIYKIHKSHVPQFQKEFNALLDEDFAANWKPVGRGELNGCKLSPMDYVHLDWLIMEALPPEGEEAVS